MNGEIENSQQRNRRCKQMEILKLKNIIIKMKKPHLNGFSSRLKITEGRVSLISVHFENRKIEIIQSEQQRGKKD